MKFFNLIASLTMPLLAGQRPTRYSILAYTGGKLRVNDIPLPVVVDLRGLTVSANAPILIDHKNDQESTFGQIVDEGIANDFAKLELHGPITGTSEKVSQVIVMATKHGHKWQASIRCNVDDYTEVAAGQRVMVNSQWQTGPFILANRSTLTETSILPAGADASTTVTLAASAASGDRAMSFEEWLAGQGIADVSKLSEPVKDALIQQYNAQQKPADAQPVVAAGASADAFAGLRGLRASEHRRIAGIESLTVGWPQICATAIEQGWTIERTENAVLKARSVQGAPSGYIRSGQVPGNSDRQNNANQEQLVLEAGLMCRAGRDELAGKLYGDQIASAGRTMRSRSLVDFCAHALHVEGRDVPHGRIEVIRAASSTLALPTALSNVTGKVLLDRYNIQKMTWRSFAKPLNAADFKPQTGIRPSFALGLERIVKGGEFKHGQAGESTFPWSVSTYGKIFKVDRVDIINDDLSILDSLPDEMSIASARAVSDLVWLTILANGGSFYSTGHGNYQEGAGTVLQLSSLEDLATLMRKQRDDKHNDLDLAPRTLVVPPELESTARALLSSELLGRDDGEPTGNPLKSFVALEVESRISNTDKFDGASATQFYLFASQQDAPVIVGFLDGKDSPTVETFDLQHDVNTLEMAFRCYFDFGCALGDYRAAAKSKGAA